MRIACDSSKIAWYSPTMSDLERPRFLSVVREERYMVYVPVDQVRRRRIRRMVWMKEKPQL